VNDNQKRASSITPGAVHFFYMGSIYAGLETHHDQLLNDLRNDAQTRAYWQTTAEKIVALLKSVEWTENIGEDVRREMIKSPKESECQNNS
jgi:hypothetical protein